MAASWDTVLSKSPIPTVVADLPPMVTSDDDVQHSGSFADDLLRYTPVPTVILDAALLVRQVSDSYLKVSGAKSREHVVGHHADDLFINTATFQVHASAREAIRTVQSTRQVHHQQYLTSDNQAWTIRCVPIYRQKTLSFIQMEFTDTTEEHRKQLLLEERLYTNETFRILVETVKDYAIFMLDPKGNVATWK
jgi:osomolarity two-component system sensor histidine kinase TcsA